MKAKREKDWGGLWTKVKLEVVDRYLKFYATALKKTRYNLWYIDGFAGDGFSYGGELGSPLRALAYERFNKFVFIDKSKKCIYSLRDIVYKKFPEQYHKVEFICGDVNDIIPRIIDPNWRNNNRGVVFLDPFGFQVKWKTIQNLANSRAIDLWLLIPVESMMRLLFKDYSKIPPSIIRRLEQFTGLSENNIKEIFYNKPKQPTLFDNLNGTSLSMDEAYRSQMSQLRFLKRYNKIIRKAFDSIFPISIEPLVLFDIEKNKYKFMLAFYCANNDQKAKNLASRVGGEIVEKISREYKDVCFINKL